MYYVHIRIHLYTYIHTLCIIYMQQTSCNKKSLLKIFNIVWSPTNGMPYYMAVSKSIILIYKINFYLYFSHNHYATRIAYNNTHTPILSGNST